MRVAHVVLDSPLPQLDHLFDYGVPNDLTRHVAVGQRVKVPLRGRNRVTNAYIVGLSEKSEFPGKLNDLIEIVTPIPLVPAQSFELARAVADRQAGSVSDVIRLMVPQRYVRAEKKFIEAMGDLNGSSVSHVASAPTQTHRRTKSRALLPATHAVAAVSVAPGVCEVDNLTIPHWAHQMSLQASEMLDAGRSSILIAPDFRDIDYLQDALTLNGLADFVVRVDAKMSGADRYTNFLRALHDPSVIVIGNRSAALTPASNLGLISLWDEGDESYIERLAPYAHTRDVILLRQSQQECAVTFMSHSRSTDIQRLVDIGFATQLAMPLPSKPNVVPTDLLVAEQAVSAARIPSSAWNDAREQVKNGPILIQVAQPGFAPAVACQSCREIARCTHCAGPLRISQQGDIPDCRWCGRKISYWTCEHCNSRELRPIATGSERTAQDLGKAFPGVKILVSSGDKPLVRVTSEPALVVATPGAEPLAEGGYRLVLILDGDRMRAREQLRVVENLLRIWTNTIALMATGGKCYVAGSGEKLGLALSAWKLGPVIERELAERVSLGLPPAARLVALEGTPSLVQKAFGSVEQIDSVRLIGTVSIEAGLERVLVSFAYKDGPQVAKELRAQVIQAAAFRRPTRDITSGISHAPKLRVKMDYPGIDG